MELKKNHKWGPLLNNEKRTNNPQGEIQIASFWTLFGPIFGPKSSSDNTKLYYTVILTMDKQKITSKGADLIFSSALKWRVVIED